MKYDQFSHSLNEIPEVLKLDRFLLNIIEGEYKSLFKKSNHKNLILDIYTSWENYIKNILFNCYENYKRVIVDKEFLLQYFQRVNEKSYTRKLFSSSLEENKLTINLENLCYSNNLNWNELLELFTRLGFHKDEFVRHLDKNVYLEKAIDDLKHDIVPIFEGSIKANSYIEYTKVYLNMMVEDRNLVAHQYEVTELYSLNQLEKIYIFIKILSEIVYEFCVSQVIKKSETKSINIVEKLIPKSVFKGNSRSSTAIIGVKNTSQNIYNIDNPFLCFDSGDNIYRLLKLKTIRLNEANAERIEPNQEYSLEVETFSKINKRNNNFLICIINEKCEEFEYSIVI